MVRALAWAVDAAIRYAVLLAGVLLLNEIGEAGLGLSLILFFLLEWLYPVPFELRYGATPGKKLFRLRVVDDAGVAVGFAASLTRNLLRAADFLPLLYGLGLITMLINRDGKRLGDLAAGTLVVYTAGAPATKLTATDTESDIVSLPLRAPLLANEQRLIVDFADRRLQLTEARQEELALLLPDLTATGQAGGPTASGSTARRRLLGHARWLRGDTPA